MLEKNIAEFEKILQSPEKITEPIKITLKHSNEFSKLQNLLEKEKIPLIKTIDKQLDEYKEIYTRLHQLSEGSYSQKIESLRSKDTQAIGNFVFFSWGEKAVYNILDKSLFYELITWRNKEKISIEEQHIISTKKIGIIGTSVGSFTCRVLAKLGFQKINIAEIKDMKPSNAPRMYHDSLRDYADHKLNPLIKGLFEFNPYIDIKAFHEGVNKKNIDDFFHIDGKKIDILIDAADDGSVKVLMREYCEKNKIPLVTGFDEKGVLMIERYDLPELLIEPKVNHTIEELEKLKISSPQEYIYKLLDFFPGGIGNISQRQKETLEGINNHTRGGFSQLAWEASLFASYVSKSVLDIALGKRIHGVKLFDFDEMISEEMENNLPYKG